MTGLHTISGLVLANLYNYHWHLEVILLVLQDVLTRFRIILLGIEECDAIDQYPGKTHYLVVL